MTKLYYLIITIFLIAFGIFIMLGLWSQPMIGLDLEATVATVLVNIFIIVWLVLAVLFIGDVPYTKHHNLPYK